MKTAKQLLQAYIDGSVQESAALFADNGALELPYLADKRGMRSSHRRKLWGISCFGARRVVMNVIATAATSGLRIGEVTALKLSSLDFKRKLIHIRAALDYTTRTKSTPKSAHSAAPLHMPELLEHHLRNWIEKSVRKALRDSDQSCRTR